MLLLAELLFWLPVKRLFVLWSLDVAFLFYQGWIIGFVKDSWAFRRFSLSGQQNAGLSSCLDL